MSVSTPNLVHAVKIPAFLVLALILNIFIFILIQKLVSKDLEFAGIADSINLVDFIRVERQAEPFEKERELEELEQPPPEEEPPPPELQEAKVEKPQSQEMDLAMPSLNVPLSISGTPYLGDFATSTRGQVKPGRPGRPKIDTNVKPTLRVPPVYPPRALRSGIEGVVTVEFTIDTDGSVKDAKIVRAKPPKIFDKAVLNAISKWKFNPDIVNGKPVAKRARQDIKFTLQR